MLQQSTKVLSGNRVHVSYAKLPNFALTMDFSPWLEMFPKGDIVFLHYQKAPFRQRRYGAFWRKGEVIGYSSFTECEGLVPGSALQLDETVVKTSPTAVIVYRDSAIKVTENSAVIQ